MSFEEAPIPPAGDLVSIVEEFNSILKKLTCDLVIRYPNDATIARAKKRIMLAIDIDPVFIITNVGPYLFKYKDEIYAEDSEFFMENDYDADLKASADAESADLSAYIIPKVKMSWRESGPAEQAAYLSIVQNLLDAYLDYLAVTMK